MYAPDTKRKESRDVMYRSNSSLDLIYAEHSSNSGLRREYGSHGSIDVIGDRLPNMVHNYNVASAEKPKGIHRSVNDRLIGTDAISNDDADGPTPRSNSSPKVRLKLTKRSGGISTQLARQTLDDQALAAVNEGSTKRQFAHYDCQSLLANLSYAADLRGTLLGRRRNTTTGASAASSDAVADGRSNELVESCPAFRNELGGEEERCVSLCFRTARGAIGNPTSDWHRPRPAYGLAILEPAAGYSHWRNECPFARTLAPLPIESQDQGALYYRNYFYGQPHQNWFGMDDTLGPIAISIKKERIELRRGSLDSSAPASQLAWHYRLIVRTSELLTLRGSVLEDSIPTIKPTNNSATYNTKDVLECVAPELQLSCLRLGLTNSGAEEQLLRLDEQCVTRHYKVGVMYCRAGQSTEEEMYSNQEAGPAFVEFLQMLGQTVRLKDFDKYKAGLDDRTDSTGLYSVYTTYQGREIMFHVSTMLPYTPNNRQQLLRKRHIGNDIVTIVFQEPGAAPFTARNILSHFQHVFVVVRAIDPCTENTHYSIAVSRAKEVPLFGPPIKEGAVYPKGETFTDLLLSKVINGENAAIQSPKFSEMATRTRQEYLKDLAKNHVTANTLESGPKFSNFMSRLKKSSNLSNNNVSSNTDNPNSQVLVGGALCFQVQVQDEGAGGVLLDCIMGISADTVVFIESTKRQVVLVIPTNTLLGWVVSGEWVRVYFHRGESVRVRGVGGAGAGGAAAGGAVLRRLAAVAPPAAAAAAHLTLQRGPAHQLGLNVQADGLVTSVEAGGGAARAGLRRGARLLEVCRAAVVALRRRQLRDLLTAADPVTVTVTFASSGRCECECTAWDECEGARGEYGGARGECGGVRSGGAKAGGARATSQAGRASPPRSDTSGYGTGGSNRSNRRSIQNSPTTETVQLRNRDENSPRHRLVRSTNTTSLTEELMRIMDAGLSESHPPAPISAPSPLSPPISAPSPLSPPISAPLPAPTPAPLPLPDAQALDWATLVHTATAAMLQICEEHTYPSMDNSDPSFDTSNDCNHDSWNDLPTHDTPSIPPTPITNGPNIHSNYPTQSPIRPTSSPNQPTGPKYPSNGPCNPNGPGCNTNGPTGCNPSNCGCGLAARVLSLEADNAAIQRHKHQLEDEVRRLRRHNARLREESARAVWQLRHFTQWLKRTVDRH